MFGTTSRHRFLCVDIQTNAIACIIVRYVSRSFSIEDTVVMTLDHPFDIYSGKDMGKLGDMLFDIRTRYGKMPVIVSLPDAYGDVSLLTDKDIDLFRVQSRKAQEKVYLWQKRFLENRTEYISVCSVRTAVCDAMYVLVKQVFDVVYVYPRAILVAHVPAFDRIYTCDVSPSAITIAYIHNGIVAETSMLPYGSAVLISAMQKEFSATEEEVHELLLLYGSAELPRKEGYRVHRIIHAHLMPIVEEIRALKQRIAGVGLETSSRMVTLGEYSQYVGIHEDLDRMAGMQHVELNIWENCIDIDRYVPKIHKKDSLRYAPVAGQMAVLHYGLTYEPIDQ